LGKRIFAAADSGDSDQLFASARCVSPGTLEISARSSVLSVVAIVFALIGGLCSTLSLEGLDLVNSLPKYRGNIHARWAAIQ
jgi:hypothetical protein